MFAGLRSSARAPVNPQAGSGHRACTGVSRTRKPSPPHGPTGSSGALPSQGQPVSNFIPSACSGDQWRHRGARYPVYPKRIHCRYFLRNKWVFLNVHTSERPCKCSAAAAAAESLQACPTLCDPVDGSPPGSPVPGILQARTLEWVAISFSNAGKCKVRVKSLSRVRLLATPWTAAHQAPPSMGFSRQECWSGVPSPSLMLVY